MLTCVTLMFFSLSHQADATHERVVKREDGERLAKVIYYEFMEIWAQFSLSG